MEKKPKALRITLNMALFISILFFPWWVSVSLMVLLLVFFRAYEILLWGLLIDLLYSAPVPSFGNILLLFTVSTVVLFLLAEGLKRRLIFYS